MSWCVVLAAISVVVRSQAYMTSAYLVRRPHPGFSFDSTVDEVSNLDKRFNEVKSRTSRQSRACPSTEDGRREFLCPLSASEGAYCIDDHEVCNGRWDCPNREDEEPIVCMFYKIIKSQLRGLTNLVLTPSDRRHRDVAGSSSWPASDI